MRGVDLETRKWDLGCTTLHGVEPWKADWHWVQKSKRQLRLVHVALWVSAECFAGEPQRLQGRRDSCCFRLLAAWMENRRFWFNLCSVVSQPPMRISEHMPKLHTGENTHLPLHSRWNAYTVRWLRLSAEILLFAYWRPGQGWMRTTGCWRRPESASRTTPPWKQPHLWSAGSPLASRSFLIPIKKKQKTLKTHQETPLKKT